MRVSLSSYYAPPEDRPATRLQRFACIFSPAFDPGDNGHRDDGACLAVPLDTDLIVVAAEDNFGSAGQLLESCTQEAWRGCLVAFRVAGLAGPVRGCPRVNQPDCLGRHHLRRYCWVRVRSSKPVEVRRRLQCGQ